MARGWAGGGDYSGFFGSLYGANKSQQQAEQDAADADMQDKWENGLATDDEWMAYIRERVDAETDPKRNERWVEALRKYGPMIADSQAETAHENGGSIAALVAYYEGRLGGLQKDSNEYREVASRLNQVKDKRDSEDLSTGAEAIVNRIKLGKASYQDLIDFYSEKKKALRPGSDLIAQIDGNINDVKTKIAQDKIEGDLEMYQYQFKAGKLSAAGFAKKIREIAGTFKESDPQRYWSLLQSALGVSKSGGSGGGGGGGGGGSTKAINKTIDVLQAQLSSAETIGKQYEEGRTYALDPVTGNKVTLNADTIRGIDRQVLDSFDALALAYDKKGDKSAAQGVRNRKAKYIVGPVVTHNTIDAKEQERQLILTTSKSLEHAAEHGDPTYAMGIVRNVAEQWSRFSKATTEKETRSNFAGDVKRRLPSETGFTYSPKAPENQVDPDFAGSVYDIANALHVISNENLTEAEFLAAKAQLDNRFGGTDIGKALDRMLVKPAANVRANKDGLATGRVAPVVVGNKTYFVEQQHVTRTVVDPSTGVPTNVTVPVLDQDALKEVSGGAYIDDEKTPVVDVMVDVNGYAVARKAVARIEHLGAARVASSNITYKKAGKEYTIMSGDLVPDSVFDTLTDLQKRKVEAVPAGAYLATSVQGKRWVQDPQTKVWYQDKLPYRFVGMNADGTMKVTDDGKYQIDFKGMADAGGLPAPYSGKDYKGAQSLALSSAIDTSELRTRDINGNVDTSRPYTVAGKYYDPSEVKRSGDYMARDDWRADSEAKIQSAQDAYLRDGYKGRKAGAMKAADLRAGGVGSALGGVFSDLGKSVGLTFGTEDEGGVRRPVLKAAKKTTTAPKIDLPPGLKAEIGETRSGPQLASLNLAATTPTKITLPAAPKAAPPVKAPVKRRVKSSAPTIGGSSMTRSGVD